MLIPVNVAVAVLSQGSWASARLAGRNNEMADLIYLIVGVGVLLAFAGYAWLLRRA